MKKQAYEMIAMIALVGALAVATQAQAGGRTPLIATIPFDFNVGNQKLPAGEYMVRVIGSDENILQISNIDGRKRVVLLTRPVPGKIQDNAKLVFNRYGDTYFFVQAWTPGLSTGMQALKSRAERNLVRELAGVKPETKVIALTRSR